MMPLFVAYSPTLLNTQDDISVTWAATDGDEALNQLSSSNQPTVKAVLLDIKMPHMDGITLASIIGTDFPQTATLMLTTFTDRQLVDKSPLRRSKWLHSKKGFY